MAKSHDVIDPVLVWAGWCLRRNTEFASQQDGAAVVAVYRKDFTGELFVPRYFIGKSTVVPLPRRANMAWKTPKIVEVPVGMEINMYACAARK
jgi:coenzyme PQQ precursor peptide PqqA